MIESEFNHGLKSESELVYGDNNGFLEPLLSVPFNSENQTVTLLKVEILVLHRFIH